MLKQDSSPARIGASKVTEHFTMRFMLWLFFGPIIGGLIFGCIQLMIYRSLVAAGRMKEENIPFFGMLLFRGMFVTLALILGFIIALKAGRAV